MICFRVCLISVLFISVSGVASSKDPKCGDLINQIHDGYDVAKKTASILKLEGICRGTGIYEARLASYFIFSGELDKAEQLIASGLKDENEFHHELLLNRGNIYLKAGDYAKSEIEYRKVIELKPSWYSGYDYLGFSLFAQGKNAQAVPILEKSVSLEKTVESYRTLTLVHHVLGNHQEVVESLGNAFSIDKSIVSDRDPMIAGARSYAEIGKYEVSRNLLLMLLKANPEVKTDSEFLKAGYYLKQKMEEAQ